MQHSKENEKTRIYKNDLISILIIQKLSIMKNTILLTISIIGLMFLTSCQSEEEKIIGKWGIIEFNVEDENVISQNNESNYIEFEKDEFFIISIEGEIQRGTWMVNKSNNEITLHFFEGWFTEDLVGKYEIMHNNMGIKGAIGNHYVFIHLEKK